MGENCCVRALVGSDPTTRLIRRGLTVTKLRAFDESGSMELTFFNQPYVKDQLRQGQEYVFYGRMGGNLLRKQMTNPEFEPAGKGAITGRILPVYRLTGGLSRKALLGAMGQALDCTAQMGDRLTDEFRARHRLCPLRDAYENIHFPQDAQALTAARRRVIFEEFFTFACGLQLMQEQDRYSPGVSLQWHDPQAFYRLLPFAPTGAQRRAVDQAFADLCSGRRMNRLIQGDVGSGKTLVAAACLWLAAKNGKQAALMAPTELLAVQHHQSLAPLLEQCGFSCGLLTGSTRKNSARPFAMPWPPAPCPWWWAPTPCWSSRCSLTGWPLPSPMNSTGSACASGRSWRAKPTRSTPLSCQPPHSPHTGAAPLWGYGSLHFG